MSWVNYAVGEWTTSRGLRNALPMRRCLTGQQVQWRNPSTGLIETIDTVNVRLLFNGKWESPQNIPHHLLYLK